MRVEFLRSSVTVNFAKEMTVLSIGQWQCNKQCPKTYSIYGKYKYSSVFRENRCPPPPKPVYGGNFSHEAANLKIRSRTPKSNKLLILSNLYRLANLVTFHPMVLEITCRQTVFGLILVDSVRQWPWKLEQGHQNLFSFLSCPNVISMQIWLKSASWFMRYCAHKHLLA